MNIDFKKDLQILNGLTPKYFINTANALIKHGGISFFQWIYQREQSG